MARFVWHIGNTTVRNPFRLRDALLALKNSPLLGDLQGRERENDFAILLYTNGVVKPAANTAVEEARTVLPEGTGSIPFLGRKWRSALVKMGFLTGKESPKPHQITLNGQRLIEASIIVGQQECFLRSLLAYRFPSPNERAARRTLTDQFSPLHLVLDILKKLTEKRTEAVISFVEMAAIVQTHSAGEGIENIVGKIMELRNQRAANKGRLKKFNNEVLERVVRELKTEVKAETLRDYADTNFRYLKATGLFVSKGRGIALDPKQLKLADLITKKPAEILDDSAYLRTLENGAALPTDNKTEALAVIDDIVSQLKRRGSLHPITPTAGLDDAQLSQLRHEYQEELRRLDELEFAQQQTGCIEEIVAYLKAILSGKKQALSDQEISVPKDERPVYLEWAVWRAFLAMDSLKNQPWEARLFQVDNDLKPISCAPGRGPDMVFEFNDHTVVVEVTLTDNSRQEAAEGEPVRRHIAVIAENSPKKTYGLFIAGNIDTNTAQTFKAGDWYRRNDSKVNLHIVPLRIEDFARLLHAGAKDLATFPARLEHFLMRCRSEANQDAPAWKAAIAKLVVQF